MTQQLLAGHLLTLSLLGHLLVGARTGNYRSKMQGFWFNSLVPILEYFMSPYNLNGHKSVCLKMHATAKRKSQRRLAFFVLNVHNQIN